MIAVLIVYNGEPLPKLPLRISLNAVITLLATGLRGSLLITAAACEYHDRGFWIIFLTMEGISQLKWNWYRRTHPLSDITTYDEASRGPRGALMLLVSPCLLRVLHYRNGCETRANLPSDLATLGAVLTVLTVVLDPFTQQIVRSRPCSSITPEQTASVL